MISQRSSDEAFNLELAFHNLNSKQNQMKLIELLFVVLFAISAILVDAAPIPRDDNPGLLEDQQLDESNDSTAALDEPSDSINESLIGETTSSLEDLEQGDSFVADEQPRNSPSSSNRHSSDNEETESSNDYFGEENVVKMNLTLSYGMAAPDGFSRPTVLINGGTPGPEIRVKQGDILILTVHNDLHYEGAALHIHGLHQRGSPQYDGVAYGTQWPILPGKSFTYKYRITNSPGTYWYHAHYQLQSQAVFGAFIIEDNKGEAPYEYDEERTMLLSDWYRASDTEQLVGLMSPTFKWIGNPDSLLVNGKTRNSPNCTACNETALSYEILPVEENKTYRFRFIGASSLSYFRVELQSHLMTIIEADGIYVRPYTVKSLEINSGERFSVLIETNQPIDNYAFKIDIRWRSQGPTTYAYLGYKGANSTDLTKIPNNDLFSSAASNYADIKSEWIHSDLKPTKRDGSYKRVPANATKTITLTGKQTKVPHHKVANATQMKWLINNSEYVPNMDLPLLMAAYQGRDKFWESIHEPSRDLVFEIERGDVVDIVLQNTVALNGICEQHPFHLHGHHFWVLGGGPGDYQTAIKAGKANLNTKDPIMKDTVTLYPYDYAFFQTVNATNAGKACGWKVIRFIADNPGVWNFHCHIAAHMHMGMQVFFAERIDEVRDLLDTASIQGGLGLGDRFTNDFISSYQ